MINEAQEDTKLSMKLPPRPSANPPQPSQQKSPPTHPPVPSWASLQAPSSWDGREGQAKGTDRGELAGEEVPVLTQHVGHHDGRQVHVLVGVGWDQAVGREAVAQGVVSSFVVHQVQEGRVREIGRCYGRDLVVLVVLILAVVRLKRERDVLQRVIALMLQQRKMIISLRNRFRFRNRNRFQRKWVCCNKKRLLQSCTPGCNEVGARL